jgi:putative ABC transport system permease protein
MSIREVASLTAVGLTSVPARIGTSMVIVVGLATVVMVLVSGLTIAEGFTRTARSTGSPDRAFVVNADRESSSALSREDAVTLLNAPGIRNSFTGEPLISAEYLTFVALRDPKTGVNVYAGVRGIGSHGRELRPEMKIVAGRWFTPGARELVIGRALQRRLGGLGEGGRIPMPDGEWQITGVFETGGDAHESEFLTDVDTLMGVNRRNEFSSMTFALKQPDGFSEFAAAVAANPALTVKVHRESEFYANASRNISSLLTAVAYGVGALMAIGALFAALNSMYTAVSTRTAEIGTLRAMGFGPVAVGISIVVEALLLALIGAVLGALVCWIALDDATMSTMSGMSHSQLTFALNVGATQVLQGLACALVVALIGGSLAAGRAVRMPVVEALRAV